MHPAIRNPLSIHSGRARKGDLQFQVQAAPSSQPVCHCAIPPDAPRPYSSARLLHPGRNMAPCICGDAAAAARLTQLMPLVFTNFSQAGNTAADW
jgi:hypothetical protein